MKVQGSLLELLVVVVSLALKCGAQDREMCDYIYMLQPPSELPCNPYQENELTGAIEYNVQFDCAIAKPGDIDNYGIQWIQQIDGSSEPKILPPNDGEYNDQFTRVNDIDGFIVYQSEIHIVNQSPLPGTHTYWCVLQPRGPRLNNGSRFNNGSSVSPNRVTIRGQNYYSSLPPCPLETSLHLAERVCVRRSMSKDPPLPVNPCPSNGETNTITDCDTTLTNSTNNTTVKDDSYSSNSAAGNNSILTTVGISVAVIIAVFVILATLVTLILCLIRRRRRNRQAIKHRGSEWGSPVSPKDGTKDHIIGQQTHPIPLQEQTSTAVVAEPTSIQSPIDQQNPTIPPPTPKKPLSAQSRATTLLRQIQRPHKRVVSKKAPPKPESQSDLDSNERGSPRRKKPYKSLVLNTVDSPHVYMTRATSPAPPQKTQSRKTSSQTPRSISREKLLLTHTTSDGYVIPETRIGGEEDDRAGQVYQEIEAETRDSIALYAVPIQRTNSTSSIEPPIYEEPKPNFINQ